MNYVCSREAMNLEICSLQSESGNKHDASSSS
jgi:hypothetical protein